MAKRRKYEDSPIWDEEYAVLPPRGMPDNNATRVGPFWDWYRAYLQSPEWKRKSRHVVACFDVCAVCLTNEPAQADHLCYIRVGREQPKDLQPICVTCHEAKHRHSFAAERFRSMT
jgi:5-methylcytosine-specific restriction endonuclease McrA